MAAVEGVPQMRTTCPQWIHDREDDWLVIGPGDDLARRS
jgi:hypothetical protein